MKFYGRSSKKTIVVSADKVALFILFAKEKVFQDEERAARLDPVLYSALSHFSTAELQAVLAAAEKAGEHEITLEAIEGPAPEEKPVVEEKAAEKPAEEKPAEPNPAAPWGDNVKPN